MATEPMMQPRTCMVGPLSRFAMPPVNAAIADINGLGTILDDDAPPAVSISNSEVTEGTGGESAPLAVADRFVACAIEGREEYGGGHVGGDHAFEHLAHHDRLVRGLHARPR